MKTNNFFYKTINESEDFFNYKINKRTDIEHVIALVYSGKLIIKKGIEKIVVEKGECAFFDCNLKVSLVKKKCGEEGFYGVFLTLNSSLLLEFYEQYDKKKIPPDIKKFNTTIIKLPQTPLIQSLYISMIPYLQWQTQPSRDLLKLKQQEGIYSLLLTDERFYSCLFSSKNPRKSESI